MTTKREIEVLILRVRDDAAREALGALVKEVGRLEREVEELRGELTSTRTTTKRRTRKSNLD